MPTRDDILNLFLANRTQTSTMNDTGRVFAELATDEAIAEAGSVDAAYVAVKAQMRSTI